MKKTIKKRVIISTTIAVVCLGFYIERKNCMAGECPQAQQIQAPLIKKNAPLTIHNETGAKVNAAFYNKRFKRSGSVIRVEKEKLDVARRAQAPYIAVSRNSTTLADRIEKSVPHAKVRRAHCVKIKSNGQGLIVTSKGKAHSH